MTSYQPVVLSKQGFLSAWRRTMALYDETCSFASSLDAFCSEAQLKRVPTGVIADDELVFFVFDRSLFSNMSSYTIITSHGVHLKETIKRYNYLSNKPTNMISWKDLTSVKLLSRKGSRIYFDGKYVINGFGIALVIYRLLNVIRWTLDRSLQSIPSLRTVQSVMTNDMLFELSTSLEDKSIKVTSDMRPMTAELEDDEDDGQCIQSLSIGKTMEADMTSLTIRKDKKTMFILQWADLAMTSSLLVHQKKIYLDDVYFCTHTGEVLEVLQAAHQIIRNDKLCST